MACELHEAYFHNVLFVFTVITIYAYPGHIEPSTVLRTRWAYIKALFYVLCFTSFVLRPFALTLLTSLHHFLIYALSFSVNAVWLVYSHLFVQGDPREPYIFRMGSTQNCAEEE